MKLTSEMIEAGQSLNGGWSMAQTSAIGVPWPLEKHWKRDAVGKEVTPENYARFLRLKDQHLNGTALEKIATGMLKGKVKNRVDPVIVERAKRLVKTAFGSNTTTCTANQCTYPKCLCGTDAK
jgi:hypothetical protein